MPTAKPEISQSAGGRGRLIGRGIVPAGETVIFDRRPSAWLIVLRSAPALVAVALGGTVLDRAVAFLAREWGMSEPRAILPVFASLGAILQISALIGAGILAWSLLDWICRRYVLTERRAIVIFGVLHQRVADVGLDRVQNVAVSKPLVPRLLGLGHVGLASAGTDGFEIVWRALSKPERAAGQVREAVGRSKEGA